MLRTCGLAIVLFASLPLWAQRDFLSADEVDQVREAQEPNERLKLYIQFARQRIDQVQSFMKEEKPGRSVMVHDLLDEYSRILDAVDTVADDALLRKLNVDLGMKAVAAGEKEMLPSLEAIRDSKPKDLERYEFVLSQAIDSTRDSMEAANEDLGQRAAEIQARDQKQKKELDEMMQPKDLDAKKAAQAKAAADESNKKKKPTLLRKGETVKKTQ